MDTRFEVCAGWMKNDPLIGYLYIDRTRGAEVMSFEYFPDWVRSHPNLILDPDLSLSAGRQYPKNGRSSFGFLEDISPDRWGRRLIERRERLDAVKEKRPSRTLMGGDYLLEVHDGGRMGGVRIRRAGTFLSCREDLAAPPMEHLQRLQDASLNYESRLSDEDKWVRMLITSGSSLGGARPKANLKDTHGDVWIAKFPSRHDEFNVGAWEMVAYELAKKCGINVPQAKLYHFSERGSTFLVKRFDREGEDKRIHFASAMTMLGETDNSEKTRSYLDIVDVMDKYGGDAYSDNRQLFKRVLFNIMISNTDDHLRNHGFLLDSHDTWTLSPAYDLNPSIDKDYLSLSIDGTSCEKDLSVAISTAELYGYHKDEAEKVVLEIQTTVSSNWRVLAEKYGISRAEREIMSRAFSEAERAPAVSLSKPSLPPGMGADGLVYDLSAYLEHVTKNNVPEKKDNTETHDAPGEER